MRIATFNVNGINARLPALLRWLDQAKPDVVCLQELKAPDEKFPIAAIREGDEITVDIDNRRLDVALSDEEIAKRIEEYESPEPPYKRGIMAKYAATVSSASKGAITS